MILDIVLTILYHFLRPFFILLTSCRIINYLLVVSYILQKLKNAHDRLKYILFTTLITLIYHLPFHYSLSISASTHIPVKSEKKGMQTHALKLVKINNIHEIYRSWILISHGPRPFPSKNRTPLTLLESSFTVQLKKSMIAGQWFSCMAKSIGCVYGQLLVAVHFNWLI